MNISKENLAEIRDHLNIAASSALDETTQRDFACDHINQVIDILDGIEYLENKKPKKFKK